MNPQRYWDADRQARFAKGLCFHCNDKYGPTNRCKTETLAIMDATREEVMPETEMVKDINDSQTSEFATISLHAILGKQPATTMKLQGILGKRRSANLGR